MSNRWSVRSASKKFREMIYEFLPQPAKVRASEFMHRHSKGPYIYHDPSVHPAAGLPRGAVTFSIDFELAWGWAYANHAARNAVELGLHERHQVPQILAVMDDYAIPATWATVGHLFLSECKRDGHGVAHADIKRLSHFHTEYWDFRSGDWFQVDPCTDFRHDPAWYAPDLIEQILHAKAGHEIGCHGFSHSGFGGYCSVEVAKCEVDAAIGAMNAFGLHPKSWVFPGNDEGHFEVIAARGFRNVRAFPVSPAEISLPIQRSDGMWAIHDSTPIDLEGQGWNFDERLERLKRFIDTAARTHLAAHIWFHPSLPAEQMKRLLFPLLKYCASLRDKGDVDILTIDQLVDATNHALDAEGKSSCVV